MLVAMVLVAAGDSCEVDCDSSGCRTYSGNHSSFISVAGSVQDQEFLLGVAIFSVTQRICALGEAEKQEPLSGRGFSL